MIPVPIWVVALVGLTILGLVLVLWSIKRRRQPRLELEPTDIEELRPSIAGLTQGTLVGGNRVELVHNGAFWDWLFRDLAAAEKTINFETFLCKQGELTHRLTEMFCAKAKQGVQVRMLLDGSGGKRFGDDDLQRLRDCGVHVATFHPVRISNLGILNNRDHRKITVIDGRIAYTGGHCVVDNWLGNAEDREHFRDTSVRVEGPVVSQLQSAFSENWIEETGEVPGGTNFFPDIEPAGDVATHAVWISAAGSPSAVKLLHYLLIHAARQRITIQNPYFLPDPDARRALLDAVRRGVEVRVMIPATDASDMPVVQHASHHHYGTLLRGGVRLFDYHRTLLHQKVVTIDGLLSAVGSTNFDDRSFELNDEISLVIYDERIALELEHAFEEDLQSATEVALETWKHRPVLHKLLDFTAFVFNEQL